MGVYNALFINIPYKTSIYIDDYDWKFIIYDENNEVVFDTSNYI